MSPNSTRRLGLYMLGLLSVGDLATPLLTDGETPPYPVAVGVALLGATSITLVARALRDPARPIRLLIGLRVLSAAAAVPAFVLDDVPTGARAAAFAVVALTAVSVLVIGAGRQSEVTA